ncbi:hypothetical protein, partial [Vibrio harveyi]
PIQSPWVRLFSFALVNCSQVDPLNADVVILTFLFLRKRPHTTLNRKRFNWLSVKKTKAIKTMSYKVVLRQGDHQKNFQNLN